MSENFIVYPAIDLWGGRAVRLAQGDPARSTAYAEDPSAPARRWLAAGARWLHVINLDAAFDPSADANRGALQALLDHCPLPARLQYGGGVRDLPTIARLLDAGVSRVILGTAALTNPDFVRRAIERHSAGRIAVSLDVANGQLRTHGWQRGLEQDPLAIARLFVERGLRTLLYTDIKSDGLGGGLNLKAASQLQRATGLQVIVAGGVASLADVRHARESGLAGVVVGRALYEGWVTPEEILALQNLEAVDAG